MWINTLSFNVFVLNIEVLFFVSPDYYIPFLHFSKIVKTTERQVRGRWGKSLPGNHELIDLKEENCLKGKNNFQYELMFMLWVIT